MVEPYGKELILDLSGCNVDTFTRKSIGGYFSRLCEVIDMQAAAPILKGTRRVGWGVNKAQRGIAADTVISITRAIKSLKGW